MSLVAATVRMNTVELLRLPAFLVPLAALPSILYLSFGLRQGGDAGLVLLGYCAFTILGTMLFQFGVGIATTRDDPWSSYLLTLPAAAWQRILAMLLVGLLFSTLFCLPLIAIGLVDGAVRGFDLPTASGAVVALAAGGLVHGLFGLAMGYWLPARGAVAIANIVYFPLAFVGGLFGGTPGGSLDAVRPWLSTGAWMDLLYAVDHGAPAGPPILILGGYAVVFGAAALLGYRRVERTTYR
jgi:ABC-2 type transport system permease protein